MQLTTKITVPFGLPLLLLSLFILIFSYIRWEDVVIRQPDGSIGIKDDVKDKALDRVDRIRNRTEFYHLVARSNGYYECPLCPPGTTTNGRYFLEFREIYRVGVSMTADTRYSKAELDRWNLDYVEIAMGSYSEMLVLETQFMANYARHPENLRRPEHRRLVTPPGSGTRLR